MRGITRIALQNARQTGETSDNIDEEIQPIDFFPGAYNTSFCFPPAFWPEPSCHSSPNPNSGTHGLICFLTFSDNIRLPVQKP